eukprot:779384-Amphidinium_carterae.5
MDMDLDCEGELPVCPPNAETASVHTSAMLGAPTEIAPVPDGGRRRGRKPKVTAEEGDKGKKSKGRCCIACKRPAEGSGVWCLDDKRALDRLAFMAKQSGPDSKKWFAEVRKSEQETVKLLTNYWNSVGGRARWSFPRCFTQESWENDVVQGVCGLVPKLPRWPLLRGRGDSQMASPLATQE